MSTIKSNFIYNLLYQVLILILPLITSPYMSRVLGAEGLGVYSYTYSIAYYFVLFAMLGVNNYGNRQVARVRDDMESLRREFWGIWGLQASLTILCLGLYLVYAIFLSKNTFATLIWIPYIASAALDVNWLFFGLERFKVTVTRNLVVKFLTFILTFCVVRGEDALMNYLILMSTSMLVSVMVLWPFVLRYVPHIRVSKNEIICHLKPNLVLFVPVVAVSLYTVLDKVMLGVMSDMVQTGLFESSNKVAAMPFTLIAALGTVMLPRASNLFATGRASEAVTHMAPSMWFAMMLSFSFSFGIVAVAPEFAPTFFGPGFENCSTIMSVIALNMPFMAWANVIRTQWLIPTGRDRAYIVSVVVGAILNLLVNLTLIPSIGAYGAAIGTLFAEIAVCIVQTIAVCRDLPIKDWFIETVPSLVSGLLMVVVVRFVASLLPGGVEGLLLEAVFGAMVYVLVFGAWCITAKNKYALELMLDPFSRLFRRLVRQNRTKRKD